MPIKLFKRIAKEIAPHTKLCALHILGDPLRVEGLRDYLDSAGGLRIELTTSGFFLSAKQSDLLLSHPNIYQINFSLTSALYQKQPIILESYLNPILEFCATHQHLKSEKFVNLRLWNLNKDISFPAKNAEIYKKLKDFFAIPAINPQQTRLAYKIHLRGANFFQWPKESAQKHSGFCYGASKQLGILCNGIVVPCCFDPKGSIMLGDISTQNLTEILNAPRTRSLIQGFKEGMRTEAYCQNCSNMSS